MERCAPEGQEGNREPVPGMPRKIKSSQGPDSKGAIALFLTAEGALHWAYAVSARPIVKISMVNHMRMNGYHTSSNELISDLNPLDRHGQAALIIGLIDKVHDPVGREYIKARFGMKINPQDLLRLVDYCASGLRMEGKKEGVYRVLKDYFAGRLSVRTVRREVGCRHHSAAVTRNRLFDALEHLDLRAMDELRRIMEERGLVQPSRSV